MRTIMVMAGLLLALVGCGAEPKPSDDSLAELRSTLIGEGYLATNTSYSTIGDPEVGVNAILDSDKPDVIDAGAERATERIAEIVWTTFPGEVSQVEVSINSGRESVLRSDELSEKFGERPDGLVEEDHTATVVIIAAGVLVAALVVLAWWRHRNRLRSR